MRQRHVQTVTRLSLSRFYTQLMGRHFCFTYCEVSVREVRTNRPTASWSLSPITIINYLFSLCLSVDVRKLKVAILARSSREMSQTVRID